MSKTKKIPVSGSLRVNVYNVLVDCIERGVEFGWMHAHKHTDAPTSAAVKNQIVDDVLNEICEYFNFDAAVSEE